jgi:hemoglobin
MDRRAIACLGKAVFDEGFAGDSALGQLLHVYFALATTTTMARYRKSADDVPDGLSIPRWSWGRLKE